MLARLAEGEATVNQLAEPFDLSLPAISKHLKVLERAGLSSAATGPSSAPARSIPDRCRSLHLGRAVPADLGGPDRPHGRAARADPPTPEGTP